jgi:hypothetical protein
VSRLDAILKVTSDTQQELLALSHKSVEHTDQLEDHEHRLKTVEANLNLASS